MSQFLVTLNADGNLVMAAGYVIPLRSGQAPILVADEATGTLAQSEPDMNGQRVFGPSQTVFTGGSGRNVRVADAPNTGVPSGFFKAFTPGEFSGTRFPDARVIYQGDASVELHDGTDVLASAPAGTIATGVPSGPIAMASTAYGETAYTSGTPFVVNLNAEGDPSGFVFPGLRLSVSSGTAVVEDYVATDADHYVSSNDPAWSLVVNADGSAAIADGTDIVATRSVGPVHDGVGGYEATSYGMTTWNGGDPFVMIAMRQLAASQAGFVWIEVTETVPGTVDAVSRPFFGATLPSPTGTVYPVPIARADGSGGVEQYQQGPIFWS